MRFTVNLDQRAYSFVSAYAEEKKISVSAAVNELVRQAEDISILKGAWPRIQMNEHGYFVVAKTGDTITLEDVKEFSEDEIPGLVERSRHTQRACFGAKSEQ